MFLSWRFTSAKCSSYCVLLFHERLVSVRQKLLPMLIILSICTWCERTTVDDSLHVRRKFSLKQIDVLCVCYVILLEINFYKKYQSSLVNISLWTAQPQNVLRILLFIFKFLYSSKVPFKKFMVELKKRY